MQVRLGFFSGLPKFLMLALMGGSHSVMAGWFPLGVFNDGSAYVDQQQVSASNGTYTVMLMMDYAKPQYNRANMKFYSTRVTVEINCTKAMGRARQIAYYSGRRLSDKNISTEGIFADWQPIGAATAVGAAFTKVCQPQNKP